MQRKKRMSWKMALLFLLATLTACGQGEEKRETKELAPAATTTAPPTVVAPAAVEPPPAVAPPPANQETDLPGSPPAAKSPAAPQALEIPAPASEATKKVEEAPKAASGGGEGGIESLETSHPAAAKSKEPVGPLRSALPAPPKMERRSDRLKSALPRP